MAVLLAVVIVASIAGSSEARADIRYGEMVRYDMTFPVDGDHYFSDTFGAPRSHGKGHQGTDIFAAKGTPVVAAAAGTVRYVNWTARSHLNPDRCCSVVVRHDDGWETRYLHLNNDDPGTDNGKGWGVARGIVPGARVHAGQMLGWAGDSGNAESTPPHLHLELLDPDGVHANPFLSLLLAGGNPPAPRVDGGELFDSTDLIRRGDRGADVTRLQELLLALGYDPGPVDGIFGPQTGAAVMAFQQDLGLTVDGLVGPQTRETVAGQLAEGSGVLGLGSSGEAVAEVQRLLADLGFAPGPADGIFGPRTLRAVLDFQRKHGLAVDGLVGPQTLSGLGIR
jgi:peptidoglycan hydrolase-like protein with peptidoglycan-binding domain